MKVVTPLKKNEKENPHFHPQRLEIGLKEVGAPLKIKIHCHQ
jgi:hypothetical protein